ncbi:ras-related protein rab-like protein-18 [Tricladium varicosporioides]|nr:ras-related protein rab-like protein-18 [Hymenoscyphus varicosporioides]
MASDESLPTLKILMIGPSGVGKSALLIRYCDDQFDSESSTATIGVDFKLKRLSIHGQPYRLNLLDTAGQERFRTLSNSYYRGAHGVILVYDISNRESFNGMERWFEEVEGNAMEGCKCVLVGSKLDKADGHGGGKGSGKREVSIEEGSRLGERWGCVGTFEVSSKTREHVKQPFEALVDAITKDKALMGSGGRKGGISVGAPSYGQDGGGCAC